MRQRWIGVLVFWAAVLALLWADWHGSTPHDRFAEPPPLALGHGPAADAGHCSLAPSSR
ncbi:hypothetical protein [Thiomonas sp.]|jgi:hypothetical protein|uniref:hypothetical protein n=1 Tax=Thiomonas sp. TaxID=2047785 RepID=UPI0026128711|nr:hypothetical protein [Thiomonas sp.]